MEKRFITGLVEYNPNPIEIMVEGINPKIICMRVVNEMIEEKRRIIKDYIDYIAYTPDDDLYKLFLQKLLDSKELKHENLTVTRDKNMWIFWYSDIIAFTLILVPKVSQKAKIFNVSAETKFISLVWQNVLNEPIKLLANKKIPLNVVSKMSNFYNHVQRDIDESNVIIEYIDTSKYDKQLANFSDCNFVYIEYPNVIIIPETVNIQDLTGKILTNKIVYSLPEVTITAEQLRINNETFTFYKYSGIIYGYQKDGHLTCGLNILLSHYLLIGDPLSKVFVTDYEQLLKHWNESFNKIVISY